MEDIRLKKEKMQLDGREFELCCNFNVIADIEAYLGEFGQILNMPPMAAARIALSCMMNEYADMQGWKESWTPRQAARFLPTDSTELNKSVAAIMDLVKDAVLAHEVDSAGEEGKN